LRGPAAVNDAVRSGAVEALLARFPGPLRLRASRLKFLGLLAVSAVFVGLCIYMLKHGRLSPSGEMKAWIGIALFGLGVLISVVMLLPGAGSLTLDQNGFERITLFLKFRTSWQRVDNFSVCEMAIRRGRRMRFVGYDDSELPINNTSRQLTGRNAALPDSYGLSHEELAVLMRRWRLQALALPIESRAAEAAPRGRSIRDEIA
jgi:hypothetical protein